MMKNRRLTKNTWYEWFDWLTSNIPGPVERSISHTKENVMKLFETNTGNNIGYRPKKVNSNYIEYKGTG